MAGLLARFRRGEGGNMALLFALVLPVMIAAAALGVDAAALNHQKRQLQGAVDMAAIFAAGDPSMAAERARRALVDAGWVAEDVPLAGLLASGGGPLVVETGRYVRDVNLDAHARFTPGAVPANAVRVDMGGSGTLHFARAFLADPPSLRASALASAAPEAGFSIGSRLASLDGGIANALLGDLLGTTLSLSVLDYRALAALDVDLLSFLGALSGSAGITAGTYDAVLASDVRLADIATAIAVAGAGGDPVALNALFALAGLIDDGIRVEMIRLIALDGLAHLGVGTPGAGAVAAVNALELLSVAALLADGRRQAALALGAGIPGVAGLSVRLVAGEPPQGAWYTVGGPGAYVRTAQLRLELKFSVLGSGGLGLGLLDITLPVYAELATAEAELTAVQCPPGRPEAGLATIAARPGVLRLAVGHVPPHLFLDTAQPLSVQRIPIVNVAGVAQVTARADVAMAQTMPYMLDFSYADVGGPPRTVSTTTPLASLTGSLVGNLDLKLEILSFNLLGGLLGGVLGTVQGLLNPVSAALDQTLVTLLNLLGVGVGEADIRLHGFYCSNAALVQ